MIRNLFLFCILLLVGIKNYAQNISFILDDNTPFEDIVSGCVVFEDIDNDNDQDLIISGSESSQQITKIYLNDGNGIFSELANTPFEPVVLSHQALSDVDNDGDLDIIFTGATDQSQNFVRITKLYINNGDNSFSLDTNNTFLGAGNSFVKFLDFDNDTDQDVIITGENANNNAISTTSLYENDGTGNFTLVSNTPFVGIRNGEIVASDLDNDDDIDILITGSSNNTGSAAELYLNNGSGDYSLVENTPFTPVSVSTTTSADIDNDGDLDIFITGSGGIPPQNISKLYLNDGNANFTLVEGAPFENIRSGSVAIKDINGDNLKDILIVGWNGIETVAKLYKNNGDSMFEEILPTTFEGIQLSSIVIEDVNNDGLNDILITGINNQSQRVTNLYINHSSLSTPEFYKNEFSLYPNPTKRKFNIKFEDYLSTFNLSIINNLGQTIYNRDFKNIQNLEINCNFLNGLYAVLITDENGVTTTKKLVINN